mgnify:CR=1 FL=1
MISILDMNRNPITVNSVITYAVAGRIKRGRVSKLLLAADDQGNTMTRAQVVSDNGRRSTIRSVENRCLLASQ